MPHATLPSAGLQAFIFCGPGVSLNTFTSTPAELPKSLVPIANRPMVWYPLDWCHRVGISDITLITPPESKAPLLSALATNPSLTSLPSPKPEVLAPAELTQTTGTGEILRLPEVQRAITRDFVVLPCDLISDMDGTRLLQQWMTLNPLSSSKKRKGALAVFYPTQGLENISTKKDETDFLASVPIASGAVSPPDGSIRGDIEQVVINMPTDTLKDKFEDDKAFLRLRQTLMQRHDGVRLRLRHRDAHVYIFPRWLKEFAAANEHLESISEDLLGLWGKAGWQPHLASKLRFPDILSDKPVSMDESQDILAEAEIEVASLSSTKATPVQPGSERPLATRVGSVVSLSTPSIVIPPLLAFVQPTPTSIVSQPLIRRVDTTAQLLSVSLYLARQAPGATPLAHEHKIHPSAHVEAQARVAEGDSLIGSNVRVGFRANIKESVVGANCEIGKYVRLTRCLLMEGAIVGDGVTLTGCIIGRRARIEGTKEDPEGSAGIQQPPQKGAARRKKDADGDDDDGKTKLTDCEVAPNFVVESGTEAKSEKLMAFDTDDLDGLDGDFDDETMDENTEDDG